MDKVQKLTYQRDVEKYLENKRVYELFENLLKSLTINQPRDPIDYLIQKLQEPEQKRIFLIGPPGSNVRELGLQLLNHLNDEVKSYTCTSVGDLLNKEVSKKSELGQKIYEYTKEFRYVPDDIVIELVKKHLSTLDKKNCILEGFPKTRVQGLAFQRAGIIPDAFIILNLPEDRIKKCARKKIANAEGSLSNLSEDEKNRIADDYALEYSLNIKHVKEIYNNYFFQIDASAADGEEPLLEEMARLVNYRINAKPPKRSSKILIMGPPGSGRSSISALLSKKFGFVYICTAHILKDQIAKKSEIGRSCLALMNNGDLVPDDIISALVNHRVQQPDSQIHGFVLDGYPKTLTQLENLKKMNIIPNLVVILECSDDLVYDRVADRKIDPLTGEIYDGKKDSRLTPEIKSRLKPLPYQKRDAIDKKQYLLND